MATKDRRVAVVTGASSGVGKSVARQLASEGWMVIAQGRDAERIAAAEAEVRAAASPEAEVHFIQTNLSSLADTARMADKIAGLTDRVDILFNNAGGMSREKVVTAEGNEALFAGNHLGHFVLTNKLLPLLRAAAADRGPGAVRIIATSSDAAFMGPGVIWEDMQGLNHYNSGLAYCTAKLANVLFTNGLAARLADNGIIAHAVHPGTIASNFASHADATTQANIATFKAYTPDEGADTVLWAALDAETGQSTGGFFYQRKPFPTNEIAKDPAAADRLWAESEKIVAACGVPI